MRRSYNFLSTYNVYFAFLRSHKKAKIHVVIYSASDKLDDDRVTYFKNLFLS